ncbi:MAG: hypothetical protein O7E52_15205 [Candidatus Poribacteria bacterium]|nr:hypothetical protein [Candidatus Poribacteria bacterium]
MDPNQPEIPTPQSASRTGWRAIIIGALLLPANAYWIASGEATSTTVSLFFNVIFILFVLLLLNRVIKQILPRAALNQGELLIIYVMLSISSGIAGLDMMRVLMAVLVGPFWYARPENEWAELFWRFIPSWLAVEDRNILKGFAEGESSFYVNRVMKAWVTPMLIWSAFIFLLVFGMLCINVLVRRQWTEAEKLSYPIIQLPLQITDGRSSLLNHRMMWIGFALGAGLDILNGLHFLFPLVPGIGGRLYDLRPFFTTKPWNAIGWTPIAVFPYAVGLGFFIPLDLSFSCWFFYLFWKTERILTSALGWHTIPEFPYIEQQTTGAYLGLFLIALWITRRHLSRILTATIKGKRQEAADEPMSYRTALIGLILSFGLILFFCHRAGMAMWSSILFFLIYYAISTAVTRMRAELGSPVHDLHFSGPDTTLVKVLGTRALNPHELTMYGLFHFFNRAYRGHVMPHQLEGFKLMERARASHRRLLWGMIVAIAMTGPVAFWAYLSDGYRYAGAIGYAWRPFNLLQSWLYYPSSPDYGAIGGLIFGAIATLFLMMMRMHFIWWAFHPAGFAVSSSWSMNVFWASIFVSWVLKLIILKVGGVKAHHQAIPLFLGMILGEFVIGGFWSLRGAIWNVPTYRFLF